MSEHTPEPWAVKQLPRNTEGCRDIGTYRDTHGQRRHFYPHLSTHGLHSDSEDAANARRTVEAVNALAGVEYVEAGSVAELVRLAQAAVEEAREGGSHYSIKRLEFILAKFKLEADDEPK